MRICLGRLSWRGRLGRVVFRSLEKIFQAISNKGWRFSFQEDLNLPESDGFDSVFGLHRSFPGVDGRPVNLPYIQVDLGDFKSLGRRANSFRDRGEGGVLILGRMSKLIL